MQEQAGKSFWYSAEKEQPEANYLSLNSGHLKISSHIFPTFPQKMNILFFFFEFPQAPWF